MSQLTASNFDDDEFITRAQLCQLFLKMSLRSFQNKRRKLYANDFPQPDARIGGFKWHVGSVRNWIANSQTTTKPKTTKATRPNIDMANHLISQINA